MLEVIKCKCGKCFAACVDGYQDQEWKDEKKEYLRIGFSVDYIQRQDFIFEQCSCPKSEKEILEQNQLTLF